MAVVFGKIQPLKKLRETLSERGIHRFNSIGEINEFLKNYNDELREVPDKEREKLDWDIQTFDVSIKAAEDLTTKNPVSKLYYYLKIRFLNNRKAVLVDNYGKIFVDRCRKSYQDLAFIKETVENLYTLISGAVGENAVVNELRKLPDTYYLINDFSLVFNPPIYNKNENDRIVSIQIDHLLISQSGIFAIETKNWSSQSVLSLDLRSPVDQIRRSSYALFVLLNSTSNFGVEHHHWGSKKIPIRNVIVMINSVPKEEFKHVKILPLSNLNSYIEYFEPIFSESEVESIFEHLIRDQIPDF